MMETPIGSPRSPGSASANVTTGGIGRGTARIRVCLVAGADGEPYQSASPLSGRRPVPPRGCRRGAHHDRTGRRGPAQGVFRHLIGGTEHTGLNGDDSDPTKGPETGVGAKVTGNLGDMSLSAGGDVVLTGAPCVAERHFSTSASIQRRRRPRGTCRTASGRIGTTSTGRSQGRSGWTQLVSAAVSATSTRASICTLVAAPVANTSAGRCP